MTRWLIKIIYLLILPNVGPGNILEGFYQYIAWPHVEKHWSFGRKLVSSVSWPGCSSSFSCTLGIPSRNTIAWWIQKLVHTRLNNTVMPTQDTSIEKINEVCRFERPERRCGSYMPIRGYSHTQRTRYSQRFPLIPSSRTALVRFKWCVTKSGESPQHDNDVRWGKRTWAPVAEESRLSATRFQRATTIYSRELDSEHCTSQFICARF